MDISGFENIISQINDDDKTSEDEKNNNIRTEQKRFTQIDDINFLTENVFTSDNNLIKNNDKKNKTEKHQFSGHRQRARERFLLNPDNISDYDLLELLLFLIIPRADTKPLAKSLIDKFKNLKNIFNANVEELNASGVNGNALKYLFLLTKTFQKRLLKEDLTDKTKIKTITQLIEYCKNIVGLLQNEEFHVLFLDPQLNLVDDKKFGVDGSSGVSLNFRELLKDCVNIKADRVVLCHNHPSGSIEPSKEDIETTQKVIDIFTTIGISVMDHIIIGNDNYFSFKENYLL